MEKLIVFCAHAVETLEYFSRQLAQAYEAKGYDIFWMDMDKTGLSAWKLRRALQGRQAVLITFNFIGLSGEEGLWELTADGTAQVSLWEQLGAVCLNIMVDHPLYYYKTLQHPISGMQVFCIDRDHTAYMHRFYPDVPCSFLPIAGNRAVGLSCLGAAGPGTLDVWMARPYPLVFTANYVPVSGIQRQLDGLEPEYRDFYYGIIEALIREPHRELFSLVEVCMRREIPDLSDSDLCTAMHTMAVVDLWVRTYFREKTVRILAEGGIPVHVFGKDWEQIPCSRPENLIVSGRMVGSADCVQAMAQGKLALNTMPWFKDGAHDRVFTAMLQGAAALTDDSGYLREQFDGSGALVFYSLDRLEELPGQVHRLLQEPESLYDVCCRGYAAAMQSHTWEQRAEVLQGYF